MSRNRRNGRVKFGCCALRIRAGEHAVLPSLSPLPAQHGPQTARCESVQVLCILSVPPAAHSATVYVYLSVSLGGVYPSAMLCV